MGHNYYGEPAWPNDLLYIFPVVILGTFACLVGLLLLGHLLFGLFLPACSGLVGRFRSVAAAFAAAGFLVLAGAFSLLRVAGGFRLERILC